MFKIVRWLVWLVVSMIIFVGLDQTLTRVPMKVPVLGQFQEFYVDFRARLLRLTRTRLDRPSIERVIESTQKQAPAPENNAAPLYLYADDTGTLHFADSLESIPAAYRKDAQPMEP